MTSENFRASKFSIGLLLAVTTVVGWALIINPQFNAVEDDTHAKVLFTRHDATYARAVVGDGNLIAVGKFGRIFRSSIERLDWKEVSSPTTEDLYGIAFRDARNGIVVGAEGTYLETVDGGRTWNSRDMNTRSDLLTVMLKADGSGIITGTFGLLWRTDSGGANWEPISITWEEVLSDVWKNYVSVEAHLYGAAMVDSTVWVVGEYGLVLISTDGGRSFERRRGGQFTDPHLFAVAIDPTDSSRGIAVGQVGLTVSTTDGGTTWEESSSWETDLYAIALHADGTVIAGDLGSVLQLPDVGRPGEFRIIATAGWADGAALGDSWIAELQHIGQDRFLVLGKGGFRTFSLPSQRIGQNPGLMKHGN